MSTPFVNPDDPSPDITQPYPEKTYYPAPAPPLAPQPAYAGPYTWAPPAYTPPAANGLATAAMVLGILAICFCWVPFGGIVLAVLAVALGGTGFAKANKTGQGKGQAITGLVCGIVALAPAVLIVVAVFSAAGTAGTAALG